MNIGSGVATSMSEVVELWLARSAAGRCVDDLQGHRGTSTCPRVQLDISLVLRTQLDRVRSLRVPVPRVHVSEMWRPRWRRPVRLD